MGAEHMGSRHDSQAVLAALDRVRIFAEENIAKAGTPEFPFGRSNRDEH